MSRATVLLRLLLAAAALPTAVSAADGALDLTFWGDGRYVGAAVPDNLGLQSLIEAPDGRLVWAGYRQSPSFYRVAWRRVEDAAHSGCVLVLPPSSFAVAQTASFDASARLVVAGFAALDAGGIQLLFARYLYPTCDLDPTFGGDGVVMLEVPATEHLNLTAIAHDGDAILFTGSVLATGADRRDGLVGRLRPDGTLDPAFSVDGLLLFDGRAGNDSFEALELGPGGRLYLGGYGNLPDGTHGDFYLVGLQANGTPIPGFGLDGLVTVDFDASAATPDDYLHDLELLPGGGFALAGFATVDSSPGRAAALAVLDADGELDPTFDGDGRLVDLQRHEYRDVFAQGNGRLVLVANSATYTTFLVARRLLSGALDPSFAGGSWVPVTFPEGGQHQVESLALQAGRVAVGGTLLRAPDDDNLAAVARLQNAYVFADGFEIGSAWFWSPTTP